VQIFTATTLGKVNNTNVNTNVQDTNATAFLTLVREVQKALSKEEDFSTKTLFRPHTMTHSIKLLLKPFKFRLIRGLYSHFSDFIKIVFIS
jgi:hypothetical protein